MIARAIVITNYDEIVNADKEAQRLGLDKMGIKPIEEISEIGFNLADVSRYLAIPATGKIVVVFKDRTEEEFELDEQLLTLLRSKFKI